MTTLTPIAPAALAQRLKSGAATLVDIREPDEFAREHIPGAVSLPLSRLESGHLSLNTHGDVVFSCRSGMRTNANCARLAGHVGGEAFMLDGGLEAWKRAGLGVDSDARAPLEINRQVQIVVGALVLTGAALAAFAHPLFLALPAVLGAGLLFAGLSGWCGMAHLLAHAPWNRRGGA
ncbi:MAG: rhodanese family protein [Hyphomonadaceae bacterium]